RAVKGNAIRSVLSGEDSTPTWVLVPHQHRDLAVGDAVTLAGGTLGAIGTGASGWTGRSLWSGWSLLAGPAQRHRVPRQIHDHLPVTREVEDAYAAAGP